MIHSDDKYLYNKFMELSLSYEDDEYEDEMAMMHAILADEIRVDDHVLILKGSIKGCRVLNEKRARGQFSFLRKGI